MVQLSHPYMTTAKTIVLTRWIFVNKVMSLLFNMLSRLVIAFLPRIKCLLNFMAAVTICSDLGAPQNKVCHCCHCLPIYLPWNEGTGCHVRSFLNVEFSATSSFTFLKRLFYSSWISAIGWCHLHIWDYWYFSCKSWGQVVLHPPQHFTWCTLHVS